MKASSLVVVLVAVGLLGLIAGRWGAAVDAARPDNAKPAEAGPDSDPLPRGALARLGTVRLRSANGIRTLIFSSDGKMLASGGGPLGSGCAYLWDPATRKEIRRLGTNVGAIAMSGDGAVLAAVCQDGDAPPGRPWERACTIHLWEPATGKELRWPAKHAATINTLLAFSKDGKILATSEQDGIHLWEVPKGTEIQKAMAGPQATLTMAISADGKRLVAGGKDKTIVIWDIAKAEVAHRIQTTGPVGGIAFAPDGETFASAGGDGLGLWKTETGENIRWFKKPPDWVLAVAFSADGKTLLSGGPDHSVRLWDVTKGEEIRQLKGATAMVEALAVSADGKTVAAGGQGTQIHLWDMEKGQELYPAEGHSSIVWALAFSPDSKTLASWGGGTTILWDVASHKPRRKMEQTAALQLVFSPDGKTLAGAGGKVVYLWDVETGQETGKLTSDGIAPLSTVAFSPDGKKLATGGNDPKVRLWELATGKVVREFEAKGSITAQVHFSNDGETLIAVGIDNKIHAWAVESGAQRRRLERSAGSRWCSVVSPDGRSVAGRADEGPLYVWDLATGRERVRIDDKLDGAWALSFSADGQRLIGALSSNALAVWDLATGQEAGRFTAHGCLARSLAWSPDDKVVASGGSEGAILLWDAGKLPGAERPAARELPAKDLDAEWQALTGEDVARAWEALGKLRARPGQALPLLKQELRPAAAVDPQVVAKLIGELNNDGLDVRESATKDLKKLGRAAEEAVRKALPNNAPDDTKRRVESVLESYQADIVPRERLPAYRMLELLEQISTAEAREVLKTLGKNETDAWMAREAQAAAARLRTREKP